MHPQRRKISSQSVRFNLVVAFSVMGLIGLTFALLTGEWYKRLVFESEQQQQGEILRFKVKDVLAKHDELARNLAEALQQSPSLRAALRQGDNDWLVKQLDEQFHQYLVSSKKLVLLQLTVFSNDLEPVAHASASSVQPVGSPTCAHLTHYAAQRHGAERLKILSDLCPHPEHALHASLVPIGGLRPEGYLLVISNPVPDLLTISRELHAPLEIRLHNGRLLAKSDQENQQAQIPTWAVTEHNIDSRGGIPVMNLRLYKDSTQLRQKLNTTRLTIMLAAVVFTLLAISLAFAIMRHRLLLPLELLTHKARLIRKSRKHLGESVPLHGCSEMQDLSKSFNAMSTQLANLYLQLEQQAFSDPLTQLPNRGWFHDQLERLRTLADRESRGFTLLIMDLDKFKSINDTLGHQAGDLVLKTIAGRINAILRGSDYLARAELVEHDTPSSDSLARMGGDEFAVLLPTTYHRNNAERVAEKIHASVSHPIDTGTTSVNPGISIGIARYPQDADNINQLIMRADLAMYDAKLRGGGFSCYEPSMERTRTDTE